MNHSTPNIALPDSDSHYIIRPRINVLGSRLDGLLSILCKWVLRLMPALFVVAHIAATGETSNFVKHWKFDPLYDLISTYTTRSPAGWAILVCMVGFAFVLGFISWHAAKRGPGFLAWFTSVAAAIGMAMMLQVAWFPLKPSLAEFTSIQEEANRPPAVNVAKPKRKAALDFKAVAEFNRMEVPKYDTSLRAHWLHCQGIDLAQFQILLSIIGARFLWERRGPDRKYWSWAQCVVLLWIVAGLLIQKLQPNFVGLSQRLVYLGLYFWMLVVVREIELKKREMAAKAETLKIPEAKMENIAHSHGIPGTEGQSATVIDAPLQS